MATGLLDAGSKPAADDISAALWAMADEKSEWGMDDPDLDQEGDEEMIRLMVDLGAMGPW